MSWPSSRSIIGRIESRVGFGGSSQEMSWRAPSKTSSVMLRRRSEREVQHHTGDASGGFHVN